MILGPFLFLSKRKSSRMFEQVLPKYSFSRETRILEFQKARWVLRKNPSTFYRRPFATEYSRTDVGSNNFSLSRYNFPPIISPRIQKKRTSFKLANDRRGLGKKRTKFLSIPVPMNFVQTKLSYTRGDWCWFRHDIIRVSRHTCAKYHIRSLVQFCCRTRKPIGGS